MLVLWTSFALTLKKVGLQDFVKGIIQGLGVYKTPVTITLSQNSYSKLIGNSMKDLELCFDANSLNRLFHFIFSDSRF
jgi:hypothetical protein